MLNLITRKIYLAQVQAQEQLDFGTWRRRSVSIRSVFIITNLNFLSFFFVDVPTALQTLTGHKTNVRCLDFYPYGTFLASGSFDTSIKLWDYRKKKNILTYKVHTKDVHCLKLSPDGRWLASGGNEGTVMVCTFVIVDLRSMFNVVYVFLALRYCSWENVGRA